jgi:hypothetical protein
MFRVIGWRSHQPIRLKATLRLPLNSDIGAVMCRSFGLIAANNVLVVRH